MKHPLVRFTSEAAGLVSKLHPEAKKLMRSAIDDLRTNPDVGEELQEELSGFRSYKPGRYRVICKFDEERKMIDVYYADHRRDIYEQFGALLKKFKTE
jgi:mRNA-degrading endonuclease RelE of RelBE toxin-antitoxin system